MLYATKQEILAVLGDNLRRARLAQNLPQKIAAERSGISLKAICNLESGKNASVLSLVSLCRTLGILDWIDTLAPSELDRSAFERSVPGKPRQRARRTRKEISVG